MKRLSLYQAAPLMLLAAFLVFNSAAWSQGRGMGKGKGQNKNKANINKLIESMPVEAPSETELNDLLYMREEEKLARDVYLALYEKWNIVVFNNIAAAEQQHTDMIGVLLKKYEIDDPYIKEHGRFKNKELAGLYADLVAKGGQSPDDALTVGAAIEDLDIYDLQRALEKTDNRDIRTVYQNLMKGSRNHARTFNGRLVAQRQTYKAQFISEEEWQAIINSDMERGAVDADGRMIFPGGGNGKGHRVAGQINCQGF